MVLLQLASEPHNNKHDKVRQCLSVSVILIDFVGWRLLCDKEKQEKRRNGLVVWWWFDRRRLWGTQILRQTVRDREKKRQQAQTHKDSDWRSDCRECHRLGRKRGRHLTHTHTHAHIHRQWNRCASLACGLHKCVLPHHSPHHCDAFNPGCDVVESSKQTKNVLSASVCMRVSCF